MKHLAKEVKVPPYNSGSLDMRLGEMRIRDGDRGKQNDSEYEGRPTYYIPTLFKHKHRLLGPTEKLTVSRSQPDLSRIKTDIDIYNLRTTSPR